MKRLRKFANRSPERTGEVGWLDHRPSAVGQLNTPEDRFGTSMSTRPGEAESSKKRLAAPLSKSLGKMWLADDCRQGWRPPGGDALQRSAPFR